MKIVVFTDVHGSYEALRALSETEEFIQADKRIFLGDVCIGCASVNECIEMLGKMDCVKILGNNDLYVCGEIPECVLRGSTPEKLEQIRFMQKMVTPENKKIVTMWGKDYFLTLAGKKFYFTHYPWDDELGDTVGSPKEKNFETRKAMFKSDADYYIFGHEHKTTCFEKEGKCYYCLGTLGLVSPGSFLEITDQDGKITLTEKTVGFNIGAEIEKMDALGYPYDKNKIKR